MVEIILAILLGIVVAYPCFLIAATIFVALYKKAEE